MTLLVRALVLIRMFLHAIIIFGVLYLLEEWTTEFNNRTSEATYCKFTFFKKITYCESRWVHI